MSFFLLNGAQQAGPATAEFKLRCKPVVEEIARRLRNRTFRRGGQLREFTVKSDPTRDQVIGLTDDAAADAASVTGVNRRVAADGSGLGGVRPQTEAV